MLIFKVFTFKNLLLKNKEGIFKTNKNKSVATLVQILEEEITDFNYDSNKNIYFLLNIFLLMFNL